MPFHDRKDAGERLARALQKFRGDRPLVIALPRGGVPVAAEIARALDAPLELLIVRKIGVPWHSELAMGAVADSTDPILIRNEDVIAMENVSETEFAAVKARELAEIRRLRQRYVAQRPFPQLVGRTIIVVDDGIATGATIRVAIRALRIGHPRRIVVAVPVASPDIVRTLQVEAEEVICLEQHEALGSIGFYYDNFGQVEDEEVIRALSTSPPAGPAKGVGA